jgi:very-short-patch-repair endonuclease
MSEQDELGRMVRGQHIELAKLQRAKERRRAMTSAEMQLWGVLRRSQFHGAHFRRQQIIAGFIVDFYCHAARLAIEVDGAAHDGQEEYDSARDEALTGYGVRVLHIGNEDVERHMPDVLKRIAENLSPQHILQEGSGVGITTPIAAGSPLLLREGGQGVRFPARRETISPLRWL